MPAPRHAAFARWTWTLFVVVALLVPMPATGTNLQGWNGVPLDKLVHFGLFAPLAWLWAGAPAENRNRAALVALAIAGALAGTTELLQHLVPTRSPDWLDFAADLAGAAAGLLVRRSS